MSIELITELSNAFGVSGFEHEVADIASRYAKDFAEVRRDKMNNLFIDYKEKGDRPLKVLLDAHLDEVGFIVQAIRPNGMIDFLPVGGWVIHNIPAHTVVIKTEGGQKIKGLTASIPPHFMTEAEKEKGLVFDALVIDVGTSSKAETEALGIDIGDPIVPDVAMEVLQEGTLLLGKAFDNRIGAAALLEVMEEFSKEATSSEVEVTGALSAQEEIGLRGAKVVANQTDADLAIVFEGCPADDTFTPDYKVQSALRKGPMLRDFDVSMITHPGFQSYALKIAEKYGTKVQRSVRKGGGTNGSAYHLANEGIPTIVVGIPVRYAHTHYGYVAYEDYVSAKELVLNILRDLTLADYEAL